MDVPCDLLDVGKEVHSLCLQLSDLLGYIFESWFQWWIVKGWTLILQGKHTQYANKWLLEWKKVTSVPNTHAKSSQCVHQILQMRVWGVNSTHINLLISPLQILPEGARLVGGRLDRWSMRDGLKLRLDFISWSRWGRQYMPLWQIFQILTCLFFHFWLMFTTLLANP